MIYNFNESFGISFDSSKEFNMKKSCVVFITGKYNIFNNLLSDKLRDFCKTGVREILSSELIESFGISVEDEVISTKVNLETFMSSVSMPNLDGKWFCSVQLEGLSKKQREWLDKYIKNPSENGILVVSSTDFRSYRPLLKNSTIKNSLNVHLCQLSFPAKPAIYNITRELFEARGIEIKELAIETFVIRMSSAYDDYNMVIDKICNENIPQEYFEAIKSADKDDFEKIEITKDMIISSMHGIENYVFDDLIYALVKNQNTDKIKKGIQVYRIIHILAEEFGYRVLVNKLKAKIDIMIKFRIAIDDGIIPILVNYYVDEAKQRLGKDNKLSEMYDYAFKRYANLASRTSLRDWMYMKLILLNVKGYSEEQYETALYSLASRRSLSELRINNDIGIENSLNADLRYIDSIQYVGEESEVIHNG